mgnify:CR=1 FL=1
MKRFLNLIDILVLLGIMLFTSIVVNNVDISNIALAEERLANIVPMVLLCIESAVALVVLSLRFKND